MMGSDFKYTWRWLWRQRSSTSLVVGMLALAIAANVVVFSLINGLFLRPFPFPSPDRLVYINETAPRWNLDIVGINYPDFHRWQTGARLSRRWPCTALIALAGDQVPAWTTFDLDPRVFGFAVLLVIGAVLLFGWAPFHAVRGNLRGTMNEAGPASTSGPGGRRTLRLLVAAEFALAAMLLVAGGLLARAYDRVQRVDPGFRPEHVLTFSIALPEAAYPAWTLARDWAPGREWVWQPSASDYGVRAVQVWIRSTGSTAAYEAYTGTGYFVLIR